VERGGAGSAGEEKEGGEREEGRTERDTRV